MAAPPSVIELLRLQDRFMCELQDLLYTDFTATLFTKAVFCDHGKAFSRLPFVCDQTPADPTFQPAQGQLVAAHSPTEGWARAVVLSQVDKTYHVGFCDLGLSQKLITSVRKLPEEFAKIPRLGVRIALRRINIDGKKFENKFRKRAVKFQYFVTEVVGSKCRAVLLSTDLHEQLCEVELSEWCAKWEDRGLRCVALHDGEAVMLASYISATKMYVRSMVEAKDKRCQALIQEVGAHCYSERAMQEMPDKGQLVACKCSLDGGYYRALVMGFRGNEIRVCYVDVGSSEFVSLNQLKQLSQKLKEVPCQVALVSLTNVAPPQPITKNVVVLMNRYAALSTKMIVKFTGSYSQGVELMINNKPLSEKINAELIPEWKLAVDEKRSPTVPVIMNNMLGEVTLPCGRPLKITVLHLETSSIFYGCHYDSDATHYVLTRMHSDLDAFCKANPDKSYVPRIDELCIVKAKDGLWYRACCTESHGYSSMVFLVDFGVHIVVYNVATRKMCEDFLWIDSTAVLCSVEGLPANPSAAFSERLETLLVPMSHHMATVTRVEDGVHFLNMPEIVETLTREGHLV